MVSEESFWATDFKKVFYIHKKVLIRPLISKFRFLENYHLKISQAEFNKIFDPQIDAEVDLNDLFIQICNVDQLGGGSDDQFEKIDFFPYTYKI